MNEDHETHERHEAPNHGRRGIRGTLSMMAMTTHDHPEDGKGSDEVSDKAAWGAATPSAHPVVLPSSPIRMRSEPNREMPFFRFVLAQFGPLWVAYPGYFIPVETERRSVTGFSRPDGQSRSQTGAPPCRQFVRIVKFPGYGCCGPGKAPFFRIKTDHLNPLMRSRHRLHELVRLRDSVVPGAARMRTERKPPDCAPQFCAWRLRFLAR
jgi:hypothetical protein